MYYQITHWQYKPLPSFELLERFERGTAIEELQIARLMKEGWHIKHQQVDFEIKEALNPPINGKKDIIICTGHIDFRIELNGNRAYGPLDFNTAPRLDTNPVVEIKSVHPNIFGKVNSMDDFRRMGSFWARYGYQLPVYCYHYNEPFGVYLLDDCLGHRKLIPMILEENLEATETALQHCKQAAVGALTDMPPACHDDPTVCADCWCWKVGICQPPAFAPTTSITTVEDDDVLEALNIIEILGEQAEAYAVAEKCVKEHMKVRGPGDYLVGEWHIIVQERRRTNYDVPKNIKDQYTTQGTATYVTWRRLEESAGA